MGAKLSSRIRAALKQLPLGPWETKREDLPGGGFAWDVVTAESERIAYTNDDLDQPKARQIAAFIAAAPEWIAQLLARGRHLVVERYVLQYLGFRFRHGDSVRLHPEACYEMQPHPPRFAYHEIIYAFRRLEIAGRIENAGTSKIAIYYIARPK